MNDLQDAFCTLPTWQANASGIHEHDDDISTETPIALVYNGISHVVLMATPCDLAELAVGFSLSEGIIESANQIYDISVETSCQGKIVQVELASAAFAKLKHRRRTMSGRTGCGLCGLESLDAVKPQLDKIPRPHGIALSAVRQTLTQFDAAQTLRARTGSVHGAAWADANGNIVAVFEDVGRHNALDKLIGWGLQNRCDWQSGFVLVSSRASFEMVVKAASAGIGCLVAVSAPTAYAIDLANEAGMTLIGFAREKRQVIYTHPEYLL